ncbi:MAG: hypothetical protein ABI416_05095 [Ginsengibacter sp.]
MRIKTIPFVTTLFYFSAAAHCTSCNVTEKNISLGAQKFLFLMERKMRRKNMRHPVTGSLSESW